MLGLFLECLRIWQLLKKGSAPSVSEWVSEWIIKSMLIYGFAQGVYRQRLCKHGNYATIDEAVFSPCRAESRRVAPRTLLRSAEINIFSLLGANCKRLDCARVWRGHVTSALPQWHHATLEAPLEGAFPAGPYRCFTPRTNEANR
jgi:hypothetical protein